MVLNHRHITPLAAGRRPSTLARRKGRVAILDPQTRTLTALNRGSVTVSVTNESMRAYTDDSSLAPITTSKTVQVVRGRTSLTRAARG
ncbi:hypothetical protein [Microtetraspora sp. NBRC 13810]|uniref:hypothetical protein n=1 Tax=Microtetraspora sp. NBRC 13810 TaxID=3030990 RepID=UPI002556F796|nr:hypothetical protein [Microtetraspora sp. NBRC 13810]